MSDSVTLTETKAERKNRLRREARAAAKAASPAAKTVPLPTVEIGGLDSRAMLCNLSISTWEGRKKDKAKSDEVTTDEKATKDAGAWWTRIIPPAALAAIGKAVNYGRTVHFKSTLPWSDSGPRILPAAMYMDYTSEIRKASENFEAAVEGFLAEYPKIVADAPVRLGGLLKEDPFPTVEALRSKFKWQIQITPMPAASDFRVDLGDEVTAEVKQSIQKQAESSMATAMNDLWTRLHGAVSKIAERLGDPEGVFRDSLIENLSALCSLLPKMNITGDAELERMRTEVESKLSKQEPEVLRKNKTARADAAAKANEIAKQMEGFFKKA